jgi:predicted dehydrogenase
MSDVTVGVIGVGALGRHHARLYGECDGCRLVGVHDHNPETAARVADELGTTVYADEAELVAAVDALSVAVPTDLHHEVVTRLLAAGKHVLVEKPIAASVEQGRDLVEKAKAAGLVLQVGHVERFNPVIRHMEERIDRPHFIEAHRLAPYPPPRPGLLPRGTEVSVVLDLMIHDIDIILHLVKSDVERIDAVGICVLSPSEDIANARVAFANGCVANITASRVSSEMMRKIRVFQSDAYLSLDYQDRKAEIVTKVGQREPVPIEDHNALQKELEDFVRCVGIAKRDGTVPAPEVSGAHGQQALEIADRITRCIAEHNSRFGESLGLSG